MGESEGHYPMGNEPETEEQILRDQLTRNLHRGRVEWLPGTRGKGKQGGVGHEVQTCHYAK